MPDRELRLYVLAPSHFCEWMRWALDYISHTYRDVRWAPGPHAFLAWHLASRTTLPILDTGTEIIQGSDRILDWAEFCGEDPDLERHFERRIGPLVRRYIYSAVLHDPASNIRDLLLDGVVEPQARIGRFLWPVTRRLMIGYAGSSERPPGSRT